MALSPQEKQRLKDIARELRLTVCLLYTSMVRPSGRMN